MLAKATNWRAGYVNERTPGFAEYSEAGLPQPSAALRLLEVSEVGEPFQMGEGDRPVDADELGKIVDGPGSAITDQAEEDPPAGGVLKSGDQPLDVPGGRRRRRAN